MWTMQSERDRRLQGGDRHECNQTALDDCMKENSTCEEKEKSKGCCEDCRGRLRRALGGCEELPDEWVTTATVIMETGREV